MQDEKLSMTPMIDVVFLLLIFFVLAFQQQDVLATLQVSRPGTPIDPPPTVETLPKLTVTPSAYHFEGYQLSLADIEDRLQRIHSLNPDVSLIVISQQAAAHARLIRVMNVCARIGIEDISLMTQ